MREKPSEFAATHEVINQATHLEPYNIYEEDTVLQEMIERENASWAKDFLLEYGKKCGSDMMQWGFQANENKPIFHSHDRYGHRIDKIEFHPAYHELMRSGIEIGLPSLPWTQPKKGAHVARLALEYMHNQADSGTGCPLTMTFASVPALQMQPNIAQEWIPKITSRIYDPENKPYYMKEGLTIGMAMTEKQGGSDVRSNTTEAYPLSTPGSGQEYELVGHKWFCSAPMCDAFLVLAKTPGGLSCFLLPRFRPDGSKNQMYIQRLKNKVGNVSNASSEVEFRGAFAWMIGEEGRGVPTIIEMVALTRFDCMVGSSSLMRQGLSQAIHHATLRKAFGQYLIEQPLMRHVLADLALEVEASLLLSARVARALDNVSNSDHEKSLLRIATAIGKYWICKRAPHFTYETMECLGGAGYVEETILPRLYREAPVNAIWEGSGNIQCLDLLRAGKRNPESLQALLIELDKSSMKNSKLKALTQSIQSHLKDIKNLELNARIIVEKMAKALQAHCLFEAGLDEFGDLFCDSRLSHENGVQYGTLAHQGCTDSLLKRAWKRIQ